MAKDELDWPRVIYRGAEDPLGQGLGESKKCDSAENFELEKKNGWRLERDPEHHKKDKPVEKVPEKAPVDLVPPAHNAVKK